jgi:hypothetical protein
VRYRCIFNIDRPLCISKEWNSGDYDFVQFKDYTQRFLDKGGFKPTNDWIQSADLGLVKPLVKQDLDKVELLNAFDIAHKRGLGLKHELNTEDLPQANPIKVAEKKNRVITLITSKEFIIGFVLLVIGTITTIVLHKYGYL